MYTSIYISLVIQTLTLLLDFVGLGVPVPTDKLIYYDLLKVDILIEFIEYFFYIWMLFNIAKVKNITPFRYFDWFITTPLMLISLMAYMSNKSHKNLREFIIDEYKIIIQVMILNALMLLFGLLAELNIIDKYLANIIGFIPFFLSYKLIYDKYYKKESNRTQKVLYWVFLVIWTMYGVASFFPYKLKNDTFNILDLFSKNAYSIVYFMFITKNYIK